MNADGRRREIGALLRSRRQALRPESLSLPLIGRRRTSGLRREEVAALAAVSTAWYTWLEQGRSIRPSVAVMRRVAQTLRLTQEEWIYISLLSGFAGEDPLLHISTPSISVESVQKILDAFSVSPAILYNRRFDILAGNAAAMAVYGQDVASCPGWERNMLWRFFKDSDRRRMYPDALQDLGILNLIEALRMNWASASDSLEQELVDELRHGSAEFDELWAQHRVSKLACVPGRIRPLSCDRTIEIEYSRLRIPDERNYAVAVLVSRSSGQDILDRHLARVC